MTDGGHTLPLVPLRYFLALVAVVTNIREFLKLGISEPAELARVEQAWTKAVHLHVTLWSRPYTRDGLW